MTLNVQRGMPALIAVANMGIGMVNKSVKSEAATELVGEVMSEDTIMNLVAALAYLVNPMNTINFMLNLGVAYVDRFIEGTRSTTKELVKSAFLDGPFGCGLVLAKIARTAIAVCNRGRTQKGLQKHCLSLLIPMI